MKIKTMVLALGLVASVTSFAQSGDSAQNNTSSIANMTNPYTTGVNRYLSQNQIAEVQNMIQGMILQNNASINQQFSIRDKKGVDIQNQINNLKNSVSVGASCGPLTIPNFERVESLPNGSYIEVYSNNRLHMYKYLCVSGAWVRLSHHLVIIPREGGGDSEHR